MNLVNIKFGIMAKKATIKFWRNLNLVIWLLKNMNACTSGLARVEAVVLVNL